MASQNLHDCEECGASFRVQSDLDLKRYQVEHCPFCGEHLSEDDLYMNGDDEEE